ncbi:MULTISPECIES: hypothetical protein [Mycobacterium avium complex (MAC)]|uniref:Uncharacterized protein n=2 Tax=Mycobacterium avium complex (MAC) TaxID=120793 RepID=A0ABX3TGE8_9MYCO|nr:MULTISPECIES: hypothetical protein [Mycobacterium avium complex (MAC)]ETB35618.1 hypothetical protein N602_26330 [Mycobacterium avium subsp. hominissuis 10-5606]ETZ44220.1 hypothetical protein L837_4346 [Mycobacterium avium MAV_061107_1842]MBG0728301.1 hypothetical protein [Mycobacterium avium]MBZ4548914.1 hypothetical protein [Mycobacterium avium subsp. hominissuis]MBZ4583080.1 hypothetical protein [Mycobacterium avium subsp. hominissuis]
MNDRQIDDYVPPLDAIALTPQSIDFFYAAPGGNELIGMMLHTDNLGEFAVLFTPEAARKVATSLTSMAVTDLDRLRHQHRQQKATDQ